MKSWVMLGKGGVWIGVLDDVNMLMNVSGSVQLLTCFVCFGEVHDTEG